MMKVLLDTNVYISYLLAPATHRIVVHVVEACLVRQDIALIVPDELVSELREAIQDKSYLRSRIPAEELEAFLSALTDVATRPLPLPFIEILARDPRDDYLLAYGLVEDADYLVSGDDDLLAIGQIDNLQIVSVVRFWEILRRREK